MPKCDFKNVSPRDFRILILELKLFKSNWPVIGTYKPSSLNNIIFITEIRKILKHKSIYDNIYYWVTLI